MAEYKINYTQSNFTGGIVAAELYGRNDFNKVKSGLKKCTNWTIREAGGLEFRRGTKYLQTIPVAAGTNFRITSIGDMILIFSTDGIRYLNSSNQWQKINYPTGVTVSDPSKLGFTELNKKLYYYNGSNKLCEVYISGTVAVTQITSFEKTITGVSITAEVLGTLPDVYVLTDHEYTFSFAKDSKHESIYAVREEQQEWASATATTYLPKSVGYGNGRFVMLSVDGNNTYVSTSTDGITWSTPVIKSALGGVSGGWSKVVFGQGMFFAYGYNGYISKSSDNGSTWSTPVQDANLGTKQGWGAFAFGDDKFVAINSDGYVSTSGDGLTWSAPVQDPTLWPVGGGSLDTNMVWLSVTFDGEKFVLLNKSALYSTSTDGATWTPIQRGTLEYKMWQSISYGNGKYIVITLNGYVSTSNDLKNWSASTQITNLGSHNWSEISYANGNFVAIGALKYTSYWLQTSSSVRANSELTRANGDSDGTGQQVNVTIKITSSQASTYNGGKIYVYKKYQGEFYFITALDVMSGKTEYMFEDQGLYTVDTSKTPKFNPGYINSDGSVSSVNSVADYGQRLFMTRTNNNVAQIIFSEVGQIDNLAFSKQRNEDEAGNLELSVSHYNLWCKVVSGLDLILSTSYTINKVSGYGELQTDTVLWDGLSKTVDPVRTRRSLIYTNGSNRNIYDLTYNEYGQYDSIDLTLLIKYIFEQKTIKRLAFKDYPIKTIYALCTDGDLYCLTYIKDQNIYAWYKIEHRGTVRDICVVNTDTEDEVYLIAQHGSSYWLEKAYHKTEDIYMDCCVVKQISDITNNTITGLDLFNGNTVRVFDSGNNLYYGDYDVMNPKTVVEGGKTVEIDDLDFNGYNVTNGTIQLPSDIELVGPIYIGLPYYAVAETIPLEFADQNGNSTIGRKKAVNEAYLRYGDSRGISYKTMGHEYDCGVCERDIADNAQFLERGQIKLHTVSEYKWDSTIKILQRQPYPARIESITLGLTFNDKS